MRTLCFSVLAAVLLLAAPAHAGEGDLDLGFGDAGVLTLAPSTSSGAEIAVPRAGGGLMLVGRTENHLMTGRVADDGRLAGALKTIGDIGESAGQINDSAPDAGGVLLGGQRFPAPPTGEGVIWRIAADGALDAAFGTGGIVSLRLTDRGSTEITAVTAQGDGRVVAAGRVFSADGSYRFLARFTPRGALDPSFGSGGIAREPGTGPNDNSYFEDVVAGRDGRLLAVGTFAPTSRSPEVGDVFRYRADGSRDGSFASGGRLEMPDARARRVAVRSDGRPVVLVSHGEGFSARWEVTRLTEAGARDSLFGSGGATALPDAHFGAWSLMLQDDRPVVVVNVESNAKGDGLVRLTADGRPEAAFGLARIPGTVRSVTVAGGHLVVAGEQRRSGTDHDFQMLVARLASASEPIASLDAVQTRQSLTRALQRGVTAPVTCGGPCRLRASLTMHGAVVASASRRLRRAGELTLHLRPRSRYRAALRGTRRVSLRLRVRVTDRGGRTRTTSRTVNLRR